jgi:hypothetical protein
MLTVIQENQGIPQTATAETLNIDLAYVNKIIGLGYKKIVVNGCHINLYPQ